MAQKREIEIAQRLSQAGKTDFLIDHSKSGQEAPVFGWNRGEDDTKGYSLYGRVYRDGIQLNFEYLTEDQARQLMAITKDW